MNEQQFTEFMNAQIAAIEASGLTPDEWIEKYAEDFRSNWESEVQTLH